MSAMKVGQEPNLVDLYMLTFKERLSSTGGFESYNLTIISEVALRQSEQERVNAQTSALLLFTVANLHYQLS